MGLRSIYGGRHLRTTMVLGTASAAAGALTGLIGIGVEGTPATHDTPVIPRHTAAPKHHRAATTAPSHVVRLYPTPRKTASKSPKPTPKPKPTVTAATAPPPSSAPTNSAPQTSAPATPPSTEPASPPASGSPRGLNPRGQPGTF